MLISEREIDEFRRDNRLIDSAEITALKDALDEAEIAWLCGDGSEAALGEVKAKLATLGVVFA